MKAYMLSMKSDPDVGCEIVFANTAREAKKQAIGKDFYEMTGDWLDLRVNRYRQFDDMENSSKREMSKQQWRDGWWFFEYGCPPVDESTDEDFYKWYDETFDNE